MRPCPRELIDAVKQARVHLRERPIPHTAIVATPGNATYEIARAVPATAALRLLRVGPK